MGSPNAWWCVASCSFSFSCAWACGCTESNDLTSRSSGPGDSSLCVRPRERERDWDWDLDLDWERAAVSERGVREEERESASAAVERDWGRWAGDSDWERRSGKWTGDRECTTPRARKGREGTMVLFEVASLREGGVELSPGCPSEMGLATTTFSCWSAVLPLPLSAPARSRSSLSFLAALENDLARLLKKFEVVAMTPLLDVSELALAVAWICGATTPSLSLGGMDVDDLGVPGLELDLELGVEEGEERGLKGDDTLRADVEFGAEESEEEGVLGVEGVDEERRCLERGLNFDMMGV